MRRRENRKPWPLVPSVSGAELLSRQWMGPVLSIIHLVLQSVQHSNTFFSSSAPQEGCHHNLQLLLEEYKQFAGVGKRGEMEGTQAVGSTLEFWGGDQSSCLTRIPGQASTGPSFWKPNTQQPQPSFPLWLPAPSTHTFYDANWKGKKGSGFVYNAINI